MKLVLVGSGEFTEAMVPVDEYIFSSVDNPVVAILPTAAGQEHDAPKWIDNGVAHFTSLGIESYGVPVLNQQDTENKELLEQVERATVLYFSGGDPGYLTRTVRNSSLGKLVMKKYLAGNLLIGSSAGAMMCGFNVLANAQNLNSPDDSAEWTAGLDLVKYVILPHFDLIEKKYTHILPMIEKEMVESFNNRWMGIDEDTALVITESGKGVVKGKGRVIVNEGVDKKNYKSEDLITF